MFFQPRSLLAPYLHNPGGKLVLPEGEACAPFFSGACFLIRRDVFLKLGGFDENIFLFYEDDDLCRRIADSGAALIYVPQAVVRHGRGRSSGAKPGRIFASRWHQAWSRAYVSRKYGLPNPAPGMFAINALKAAGACLTFRRKLIERYGGSAAGALAFLKGEKALERERCSMSVFSFWNERAQRLDGPGAGQEQLRPDPARSRARRRRVPCLQRRPRASSPTSR